jgi:hypothetical protein
MCRFQTGRCACGHGWRETAGQLRVRQDQWRGRFCDLVNAHQPLFLSLFSSCASIAVKSLKSTIDMSSLERPLGGHGRGGRLDRGVIHHGREAAQKRFWTKGGSTIVREGNCRKWRVTCRLIIYCITSYVTIKDCCSFTTASCLSAAAHDSGVRPKLSFESASTSSRSTCHPFSVQEDP